MPESRASDTGDPRAPDYRRRFAAGTQIFGEGEHGDHAYIIERGQVDISFQRQGRQTVIASLGPGEIFGEMALIDDRPRSATATAGTETEVVVVRREQIRAALKGAEPTVKLLLEVLLGRFRSMQGRMTVAELPAAPAGSARVAGDAKAAEHQEAIERLKFEQELQQAIEKEQFRLEFQPVISLKDGAVAGFEALIRWHHDQRGFLPPSHFIQIAEAAKLIRGIDRWICRNAVATLGRLQQEKGSFTDRLPFVSINLSGASFADDTVIEDLSRAIRDSRLAVSQVKVEITEGVLMDHPKQASLVLDALAAEGIKVALDDFGTGYSSLAYLVGFPISTLKIDRMFVRNMLERETSFEVVRAIIGMAHTLRMDVIAEGIEEVPELQALWQMSCEYGQGFLLSRPIPPDAAYDFAKSGPVITRGPVLLQRAD